ncbi:isoamylase [Thermoflexales bacterium]|nr:isoamylase [Thermoflexales bacterium]
MYVKGGNLRSIDAWEERYGAPSPLGATRVEDFWAYNFALYSRDATDVTLLLYDEHDFVNPVYEYRFDYRVNKTGRVWHCWVPFDLAGAACYYAYRIDGPHAPEHGLRFDPTKILLDPFAREVFFPPDYDRDACTQPGSTAGRAPLGVLPSDQAPFDWGGDPRPRHTHDAIVYELHVKGFTARSNSGVSPDKRGTFAGLVEKIPYLQELGVTVVELMPIQQFDPQEGNYWGYMTLNFFAPHHAYAGGNAHDEFCAMVRAFHEVNIEVWLDVVYNHTSEGDQHGPTYSYRGIDNASYYLLTPDRQHYLNDTGCGNTLRCASSAARLLVLNSLEYYADEMHVDGFRFDLASIFTRNPDGSINHDDPPIIAEISLLAHARDVSVTAEAWDIGTYQLGRAFPGLTWHQWNGQYRDDLRSFVKSNAGQVPALMRRLYGSDDLFPNTLLDACHPYQTVNFIDCHDGFNLYDLVSHNRKHNEANGQGNADGADANLSWNCGHEGDVNVPPEVMALRKQQIKNFCALLMLSNGTPMFVAGDEFLHTQRGNNNPYNQDNEITWLDWDRLASHRDIFRFFKLMIAFRKAHRSIHRPTFWREDIHWYGPTGKVDLSPEARTLAYCLRGDSEYDNDLYVLINACWEDLDFAIQEGRGWKRVIDTSLPSPQDILASGNEEPIGAVRYRVKARSVVVLIK